MDNNCQPLLIKQRFVCCASMRLLLYFVVVLQLFIITTSDLSAQGPGLSFVLQTQLAESDDTLALAAGDLDGDGTVDLIVGNRGQNRIYFNGDHAAFATVVLFGGNKTTVAIAIGDLNHDGYPDIVTNNEDGLQIFLNDGTGNVVLASTIGGAATVGDALRLGDLDGDGDYDIVVARAQANSVIYRNNGQGQFVEASQLSPGFEPQLIDEDGDGDLDLLLLQRDNSQPTKSYLYRYRNNDRGQLVASRLVLPGGNPLNQSFAAADFDRDGDLDFVVSSVTNNCTATNCEDLRLVINRGLLGYVAIQLDTAAAGRLAFNDLDLDGDLDVVSTGLAGDYTRMDDRQSRVYLQNTINPLLGTASFTPINVGTAQSVVHDLALADLNNDGLLDIALGTTGRNSIYHNLPGYFFGRCESNPLLLDPRLMADINNDSYPDLILQSGVVLYNDQSGNFQPALSLALLLALDSQVTTADLNGDGRLDLIVGHRDRAAMIYLQTQAGQFAPPFPLDANSYPATSIVTGDLNSDNHLDIVVGRGSSSLSTSSQAAPNLIYFNNGNGGFGSGTPFSTISDDTQAVALGDLDADGDLDIAVANATVVQGVQQGQQNYLYFNDGTGSFAQPRPVGPGTDRSRTVAIGDLNGDGQLDLVFGNEDQLNTLYVNDGSGGFQQSVPIGQLPDATTNLLLVDLDQDRDLDLIAANALQADALFLNNGQGQLTAMAAWAEPSPNARAWTVGAGDLDRDGDIDLVADLQPLSLIPQLADCVMVAKRIAPPTTAEHLPRVVLQQPGQTVGSGPYASAQLFAQAEIPIDFFLFDPAATAVNIQGYYSLNGGGQWYPALASAATATRDLATKSGSGPAHHRFTWDVYGNQFLGHSDNVIFRLEVLPSQQPVQNGQPIGAPRGYVAAESYPLRVRGTQVRVVNENGMPVVGALLYKLSPDSATRADSFPLRNGSAVRTNPMGFIESRGQLSPGDQLIALQPISATHAFTLYHSSATPSNSGLNPFVVRAAGIQTLTVRSENSLTLFNLQLSLEWDARNDASFLGDLQRAIENASDVLFDVTEGQVALGDVTVYQAKEAWNNAHVVIYASNSIHPSATMGGVVITPTSEIGINGIIPAAYWPGQVRMGPQWDPFGQNEAELRQDWWLAFAHELAHYLLFLPDNYLGVEDGILRHIDCQGSFMTNTYEETYREFLTRDRWDQQENCWRKSIAAHLTGRSDWETVGTFLPWLQLPSNAAAINPGPMWLPLRMTRVIMTAPPSTVPPATLPTRNFDLRNNETGEITRLQQATAYLIKQRNTPQLEDDEIIALGSTGAGSDRIKVRGAQEGDRLCLFENNRVVPLLGCEILRADSTSIRLHEVEGWQPEIAVTPLNSVTIAIDLVQAIDSRQELRVQLLPADGQSLDGRDAVAPWATMQRVDGPAAGHFQQTIVLAQPVFAGYVRVWLVDDPLGREAITQFALSAGWGPNSRPTSHVDRRVWGPNSRPTSHANQRAWGANSRAMGAPVASSDGRATIFNVENVLGESGASVLQTVNTFPALPLWLAPVGSGYSYVGNTAFDKTIAFHYLEREVPKGYEHTLTLYYGPNVVGTENAVSWQRLSTVLDTDENFAAAKMPQNAQNGEGIYVLMATVEMPALTRGWNLFAYPIPGEREVATALASVAGAYSAIYHFDPGRTTPWKLYDPTVVNAHPAYATLINDLDALRFGHSYWLHVTSAITPYLAIGSVDGSGTTNAAVVNTLLPPSTLYGPLTVEESVVLTSGVKVNALVNGVVCGEGEILQSNGEWIYKLQVAAGDGKNGCGYFEAPISVVGHGFVAREEPLWNNRRALYQPLILRATNTSSPRTPVDPKDQPSDGSGELSYQIYLPILKR